MYIAILQNSVYCEYTKQKKEDLYTKLKQVSWKHSSPILLAIYHLSSRLIHVRKEKVDQTLGGLHAILDVPDDQATPLRLHHLSFRDFPLKDDRCSDTHFSVDEKHAQEHLAKTIVYGLCPKRSRNKSVECMLTVVYPRMLRAMSYSDAFRQSFSMHTCTGFSILPKAALRFLTMVRFTTC